MSSCISRFSIEAAVMQSANTHTYQNAVNSHQIMFAALIAQPFKHLVCVRTP